MRTNTGHLGRSFAVAMALMFASFAPMPAIGAVTELANAPLASGVTSSNTVKPNIAFIVDDSGSMDDQNMPDDESTNKSDRCWGWSRYNTLFYNPAYTYKPPFKIGGAVYSDGVTRFPDATFTSALKDGYFPAGGYTYGGGSTSNTSTNLSTLANLTPNAVSCTTSTQATATITSDGSFGSNRCYRATSITVSTGSGTVELLSAPAPSATSCSTNADTFGQSMRDRINANTGTTGFSASYSTGSNRLTITAPLSLGNFTGALSPVIQKISGSGSETFATTDFSGGSISECASSPTKYYYSKHKTDPNSSSCEADSNYEIVIDPDKIEAPGIPNTGRTAAQIAAAKTNYANWYTYYRNRASMMKAAAGEAFKDLDESKYRVGLFFINSVESQAYGTSNHSNSDLKIADYAGSASGTQRYEWYNRLYGGRIDGWTPLRGALARMGRMYAGKISGWDPVQYSCQQNFTILSTDGYWNTNAETSSYGPKQEDGSTDVGNTDGGAAGASAATATITNDGSFGSSRCYRAASITVNTGGTTTELMNAPAPSATTCSTNADSFGQAVRDQINARTGTTGFSATYSSSTHRLTITAPLSLGNFSATPSPIFQKISGSGSETFTTTAFSGGSAASTGAPLPYKDALNVSNTLADIAYYYYTTDLRDQVALGNCSNTIGGTVYSDLCKNNVRGSGKDVNAQQHMTTFTIGLGVSGAIKYESNYESATDVAGVTQYYDIANGSANWPSPFASPTETHRIDDLWHAAVNGRGTYYSATDANTLKQGIQSALAGIDVRKGSSAAAATSNLEPVAGDNFVYVALYQTMKWDGDLKAYSIDPDTGTLSGSEIWSAQAKLDAQLSAAGTSADGRTIKFFSAGATGKLKDFTSANLTADGLATNFSNVCSKTPAIDQCGTDGDDLTSAQMTEANKADVLVSYLRGRSQYEDKAGNATENRLFRGRDHVLGDVVNAVPVYMKKPPFSYDAYDTTYATFKSDNASRASTVYIAANDGMLHAVNADDGTERWAYVPTAVMPNMWRLADRNYANNHQYFVDGSPTIADICSSLNSDNAQLCASAGNWKTILIGGLNKGGCGYYALDVTNPANPKGLWEFTNANLGYSFGNPVVAKRKNGQWVVIFSSGYNNYPGNGCGSTGDGNGHVFVVDAATGALLEDIPTYTAGTTPAGTSASPSGLAKLNAWIEDASLPVADRLYGGDLLGNVWRIDFDGNYAPAGKEALRVAQLKDGTGAHNPQPITVKPELAEVTAAGVKYPIILVGTGRYLGSNDPSDTSQQSVYALKDSLAATGIADARGASMVGRTLTETTGSSGGSLAGKTIRTIAGATIDWASEDGWYLDFNPSNLSPGERVNVDMSLQFNMLTVATNVPANNACDIGGYAFLYFLDINTGKNLITATDSMAGVRLGGNALVAGIKTVKLTSGKTVTIVTDTGGGVSSEDNPGSGGNTGAPARRTTWREIPD